MPVRAKEPKPEFKPIDKVFLLRPIDHSKITTVKELMTYFGPGVPIPALEQRPQ